MKKALIIALLFTLTLVSVFCCKNNACAEVLPWNVDVDVCYGAKTVHYNLQNHLNEATQRTCQSCYLGVKGKKQVAQELFDMGFTAREVGEYVLPGFTKLVKSFSSVERRKQDAKARFCDGKFTYCEGVDGKAIDEKALLFCMLNCTGAHTSIVLPVVTDKALSVSELEKVTVLRGKFTTAFYGSKQERCQNIERAVSFVNNKVVKDGEVFSFNNTVGARTEANGYKTAKVIVDGKYTDGVGGGVCQVSTTLYNALLLSDLPVSEVHRHTLVSSYVKVGFDAMVSYGYADLKFVNDTGADIYICAYVHDKTVTFEIYGAPNKYKIVRESEEERIPYETLYVKDDTKTNQGNKRVQVGSDGVKSKSYLCYYVDGKLVERKLIRCDMYKKVDEIIAVE